MSTLDAAALEVERLPFDVPDVARVHGIAVLLFLAAALWLALRLRHGDAPADLFGRAQSLITVVVLQGALGYTQYFLDVPALLVGVHVAGSIVVWVVALNLHLNVRHPISPDEEAPVLPGDLVTT